MGLGLHTCQTAGRHTFRRTQFLSPSRGRPKPPHQRTGSTCQKSFKVARNAVFWAARGAMRRGSGWGALDGPRHLRNFDEIGTNILLPIQHPTPSDWLCHSQVERRRCRETANSFRVFTTHNNIPSALSCITRLQN